MRLPSRIRWPRTLAAQLIVVTATTVLLSNLGIALWMVSTHERLTESALMGRLLDRAVSAATLLSGIPPGEREAAVHTMSSGPWRFRLKSDALKSAPMDAKETALASRARAMLPAARQTGPVSVHLLPPDARPNMAHRHRRHQHPVAGIVEIKIPVVQGTDLVTTVFLPRREPWPFQFILAALVAVVTASTVAAFVARRVARPLSKLADAASEVARGGDAPRMEETGPDDVRHAAIAFNAMTDQVTRTLESQRKLLSAVGHDLRTPITAMRISAEFITDDEVRGRIEKNLDELQTLTEAVLTAARGAGWEERRQIDVAALVDSVCADLEEIGEPVTWISGPPVPTACRPNEIRRAVRNLIENAVTYGHSAHVQLEDEGDIIAIIVDDEGPGISEADQARVFEPFVRLETSRSQETGGAGLGLTLVKAIAEAHGGSIALTNRPSGGLRAILRLPREAKAA